MLYRLLPLLDHPRDRRGHSLPLHSTDLQFHIREVEEEHLSLTPEPRPSYQLPPLPEQFGCSKLKRTPIADPLGVSPGLPSKLNLDPTSVALLLRKSAAAICCNVGYHSRNHYNLSPHTMCVCVCECSLSHTQALLLEHWIRWLESWETT